MNNFWWLLGLAFLPQEAAAFEGYFSCPLGFLLFEQNGFDACIHLSKQFFNRSTANYYCHEIQGSLIRIDSLQRSAQLASLTGNKSIEVWIQDESIIRENEKASSEVNKLNNSDNNVRFGDPEALNTIPIQTPCAVASHTAWEAKKCSYLYPAACFVSPEHKTGIMPVLVFSSLFRVSLTSLSTVGCRFN